MELHNNCNPDIEPRVSIDCGGVDTSRTEIKNARDLYCLLNGDNASDHYDITANIVIDGDWTPINSAGLYQAPEFEWEDPVIVPITLDGNGHTITGLNQALFASVCPGTVIQNLHLLGIWRDPEHVAQGFSDGGFIQEGIATFINCSASGEIGDGVYSGVVGGFVGGSYGESGGQPLSFKNCVNHVKVNTGEIAGGFAGHVALSGGDLLVDNCANYGDITVSDWLFNRAIGGFFGYVEIFGQVLAGTNGDYNVNYGKIDARHTMNVSAVVRSADESSSGEERDGLTHITGSPDAGGFGGYINGGNITIKNFINNGRIINQADQQDSQSYAYNAAGVTGTAYATDLMFDGCISNADVICEGSKSASVGGITGRMIATEAVFTNNYVSSIDIIGDVQSGWGAAGLGVLHEQTFLSITAHGNVVTAKRIVTGANSEVGRLFNQLFGNEGNLDYVYDNYAIDSMKLTGVVMTHDCNGQVSLNDEMLQEKYASACGDLPFIGLSLRNGADVDADEIPRVLILNSRNLDPEKVFIWETPVEALRAQSGINAADFDFDPATERPDHIPQGASFKCWSLDEAGKQCVTNTSQITSDVTVLFAQYVCGSVGFDYLEGPACVFVGCPQGCKQVGTEACECEGMLSGNVLASLGEIVSSIAAGESGGAEVIKAGAATLAVIKNPLAALVSTEKRQLIDGVYNIYKNIADMECVMLRKLCCSVRAVCNCGPSSLNPDECCSLPTGMQYAMEDVVSSIADVESASGGLMLESAYVIKDTVDSYADVGELQDIMHGIQGLTCITSQIENTMADKLCMSLNAACSCSGPSGCVTEPMSDSISKVIESISDTEQGVGKLVQFGAEALETLDAATTSAQDVLAVMNSVGSLADSALAIEQASMRKLCTSLGILCPSDNNPPLCPDVPLDCAGMCMGVTGSCR
ncbi:hypothetical protein AGMMS49992_10190 [Clostridia bacterium]|nr:hypothetical protein AGMMS49992_10190 [Clostridia bacterium]